ncbi:MAG: DNA repair protein RecN [Clostridiales bacterium]|nr:DNA repair protein RecN [Clostridiales bacterium]
MLKILTIHNIALIENLTLEFYDGLNILSGETGAGKSIIIDSLNFVLGERADRSLIRHGTDMAEVEAVFENISDDAENYLKEMGIEPEEVLIIRRKMTEGGKNECRINGRLVTLSVLKGLTELLVDIHGQHEHQSLLKVSTHIDMLDGFAGDMVLPLKNSVSDSYRRYSKIKSELKRFGNGEERARKIDILKFQIDEIKQAAIKEGEEEELLDRRKRARNTERIVSAVMGAVELLDGDDSVLSKLKTSQTLVNQVSEYDERLNGLSERLEAARIEIKDIALELEAVAEKINFDARSLEEIERRLEIVRSISRKYGGSVERVLKFLSDAETEYEELIHADEIVEKLSLDLIKEEKILVNELSKLTEARKEAAEALSNKITKELKDLGMGGSRFEVYFKDNGGDVLNNATANGADEVEFMISPNIGEPLKPLGKIISGGEMSRFMLALKNITCDVDGIGTMVFDEIDTGISGHIAEVVAMKLCSISRRRQVLAVTHLPQLSSMADHHYLISKFSDGVKTYTNVSLLEDSLPEIARLIGGSDYSGHAIPHARKMKEWADNYKKSLLV